MESSSESPLGLEPTLISSEHVEDLRFNVLAVATQQALQRALVTGDGRLFTVSTEGLYEAYLDAYVDPVERQVHTCRTCQHFIERLGGAVWLSADGRMGSAVWGVEDDDLEVLPRTFRRVVSVLRSIVEMRPVAGQLLWGGQLWGSAFAGGFTHLWAKVPECRGLGALTPGQAMAEKREDFKHLSRAIVEMEPAVVARAVEMLEVGGLARGAELAPMGRFLRDVQRATAEAKGERRRRIIWHAVGRAARGWCSPRGSAFGALVEDIDEGRAVDATQRAHDARVAPGRYQRPQAAPTSGNIDQAERIIEQLGLRPSLARRPLRLDELEAFWTEPEPKSERPTEGVFGALRARPLPVPQGTLASGAQPMTWAKFQRDVLPSAQQLSLLVPFVGSFAALTTACDPSAPPLLRWDAMDRRNPVSWYVYTKGSAASRWCLQPQRHARVLALSRLPCMWREPSEADRVAHGGAVLAVLEHARDEGTPGIGLFPQLLRSELHGVRATIEAYSNRTRLAEEPGARASGYLISGQETVELQVTLATGTARYRIDRLE